MILFVCFSDWAGLVQCHLWCPHSDRIPGDVSGMEAFRGGLLIVWSPLNQWGSVFDLGSVCGLETFSFREHCVCRWFRQGRDNPGLRGHSTENTKSWGPSGWWWLQPNSLTTSSLASLWSPEGSGTTGITHRRHPPGCRLTALVQQCLAIRVPWLGQSSTAGWTGSLVLRPSDVCPPLTLTSPTSGAPWKVLVLFIQSVDFLFSKLSVKSISLTVGTFWSLCSGNFFRTFTFDPGFLHTLPGSRVRV